MRFCCLGSGSSGNASLIVSDNAKVLIDNGFSYKKLCERTALAGEDLDDLQAVFVTNEHSDHAGGIGVLSRKLDVPVYMTEETYKNLPKSVGKLSNVELFESGDAFSFDGLGIHSYSTSHDAADPVCYTATSKRGGKLGFAHDLGHSSQLVKSRLQGCHALVLEANYCPDMLRQGPYPPQVQQRIRSRIGHLSNQDMSSLLHGLLHDALQSVILMHISENNNEAALVRKMAEGVMKGHPAQLLLAEQDVPTPVIEVIP